MRKGKWTGAAQQFHLPVTWHVRDILGRLKGDVTMLPTERIAYSAIKDRPRLELPGGARLVVWVIVNVEEWNPRDTMPRTSHRQ